MKRRILEWTLFGICFAFVIYLAVEGANAIWDAYWWPR